jgi:hypothetical protein
MKPTKESMDMVVDLISMVYSEIARDNVMLREQVKALQGRITKENMDMVELAYNKLSMIHSETMLDNVRLQEQIKALQGRITFIGWLKYKFGGCNK